MEQQPSIKLPHDIYDVWVLSMDTWQAWLIGISAFLLVALVGWWIWKRKRKSSDKAIKKSLEEIIADKVQNLKPEMPFERSQQKKYFFEASQCLREMLEHYCKIPASDMTSEEIIRWIATAREEKQITYKQIGEFLATADEVKFAHKGATLNDALTAQEKLQEWFVALKPRPLVNQEVR